jgi:hypothetical protein
MFMHKMVASYAKRIVHQLQQEQQKSRVRHEDAEDNIYASGSQSDAIYSSLPALDNLLLLIDEGAGFSDAICEYGYKGILQAWSATHSSSTSARQAHDARMGILHANHTHMQWCDRLRQAVLRGIVDGHPRDWDPQKLSLGPRNIIYLKLYRASKWIANLVILIDYL